MDLMADHHCSRLSADPERPEFAQQVEELLSQA